MVPFAPQSLQFDDYRQYRSESSHYQIVNDAFTTSTPTVYTTNHNPHWNTGHSNYYPPRYGESCYQPIPGSQYSSYLSSINVPEHRFQIQEFPIAPLRENCTTPQPNYAISSSAIQEMKYFGFPNYGFGCNPISQMPPATQALVDMDVSTGNQRRTISPISTLSSSDVASVGFNSDEQACNQPAPESEIVINEMPSNSFHKGIDTNGADKEPRTDNTTQTKTEKDLERRRKNNEASRKSRTQRRDRFLKEIKEVEFLKTENVRLKGLLKELELAIKEANDALISKFHYQTSSDQFPNM
ncbi:unnamed protein product [Rodentolepis nana]|uniref:BZIP domain-containing protein n=1 Tax=Rodentolepis nana TaxID=102285 RepID=A0A0R3TLT3_RODNA|nr:unnamed protein product [Rodentolepis nana]